MITTPSPTHLALHNISKTYHDRHKTVPAVSPINLSVAAGQFVSLVGPSGCGKSTLFKLIVGLTEPDTGEIRLNGQPIPHRKGQFGYMPQRDLLLPWRTVLDNVILGPEIAGTSLPAARKSALDLLPLFGLEGFAQAYPATLSGGMRQRAALLRTVLCQRDLMLLDEPFGALDALTRQGLHLWLLDICRQFNKTILFITHDIEEAVFLSDRVITLSPRPAQIKLDLPIDLPRPRQSGLSITPEFVALKAQLLESLG